MNHSKQCFEGLHHRHRLAVSQKFRFRSAHGTERLSGGFPLHGTPTVKQDQSLTASTSLGGKTDVRICFNQFWMSGDWKIVVGTPVLLTWTIHQTLGGIRCQVTQDVITNPYLLKALDETAPITIGARRSPPERPGFPPKSRPLPVLWGLPTLAWGEFWG